MNYRYLLWFFGGLATGAGATYLVLNKKHFNDVTVEAEALAAKEVQAIKDSYERKEAALQSKNKPDISTMIDAASEAVAEATKAVNIISENAYAAEEAVEKMVETVKEVHEEKKKTKVPPPYEISSGEYNDMLFDSAKVELIMLSDGVIIDDEYQIRHLDRELGSNNLEAFKEDDSKLTLYIRNEKKKGGKATDYCIMKDDRSYSDFTGEELPEDYTEV